MKWIVENTLQRYWLSANEVNTETAWAHLVGWLQGYFLHCPAEDESEYLYLFLQSIALTRQAMAASAAAQAVGL